MRIPIPRALVKGRRDNNFRARYSLLEQRSIDLSNTRFYESLVMR